MSMFRFTKLLIRLGIGTEFRSMPRVMGLECQAVFGRPLVPSSPV
jgi:hypothetical protein